MSIYILVYLENTFSLRRKSLLVHCKMCICGDTLLNLFCSCIASRMLQRQYNQYGYFRGATEWVVIHIKNLKTFKYLGPLLTNQNSANEEIKCRLNAGKSCYY